MAKMDIELKKVRTPKFRVSFPSVFEKKVWEGQEKSKYGVRMVFDVPFSEHRKDPLLKKMRVAVANACKEKWGEDPKKWPAKLAMPFNDGDSTEFPDHQGKTFVNCGSEQRPGLVDQKVRKIIDPDQFYAGCYAHADVIAFAYDKMGNKGVSFSLQNIQKLAEGEPLSGRPDPESVFDAVDGEDDEDIPDEDEDYLG